MHVFRCLLTASYLRARSSDRPEKSKKLRYSDATNWLNSLLQADRKSICTSTWQQGWAIWPKCINLLNGIKYLVANRALFNVNPLLTLTQALQRNTDIYCYYTPPVNALTVLCDWCLIVFINQSGASTCTLCPCLIYTFVHVKIINICNNVNMFSSASDLSVQSSCV